MIAFKKMNERFQWLKTERKRLKNTWATIEQGSTFVALEIFLQKKWLPSNKYETVHHPHMFQITDNGKKHVSLPKRILHTKKRLPVTDSIPANQYVYTNINVNMKEQVLF